MVGKIFITRTGYDPEYGNHIKDPFLEGEPSLGACRPDIRRTLKEGDHVFTITGKLPKFPTINQYVMCGFEVAEKISAMEAYSRFPAQRLRKADNGQLLGNVVVDSTGDKHSLDQHNDSEERFQRRIQNFIVGKNLVMPQTSEEIAQAREETMDILCRVVGKLGRQPFDLIGRSGMKLTEKKVVMLIEWLQSIKQVDQRKVSRFK